MIDNLKRNSFLKISIGIVYLWFGALKFFPELSPAEGLATDTIAALTLGTIPASIAIVLLAFIEVIIGLCFLLNSYTKKIAFAALVHLACTFTPLLFFYDISFNGYPIFLTLVGQYIIKNLIIVAALLSIIKGEDAQLRSAKILKNQKKG